MPPSGQIVDLSKAPHAATQCRSGSGTCVSCVMMSLLTVILRFLGVLATLMGCNVYSYSAKRCKFQRQRRVQSIVTQLHRFWLRPWIIISFLMYSYWFLAGLVRALGSLDTISDNALMVVYLFAAVVTKYQNVIACVSIAYIYKYRRNRVQWILNEFLIIYHNSRLLHGHAPRINWLFFLIYLRVSYEASILTFHDTTFTHIPFADRKSIMHDIFKCSIILFLIIQPFILSLLVHLGLLILHGLYEQALLVKGCRTAQAYRQLLEHYVALIRLRERYETLLRPFIIMYLISDFNACMIGLHLFLYDQRRVTLLIYYLSTFMVYPLCFMYHSTRMREAERQFGNQLINFKRKNEKQLKVSEMA